MHNDPVIKLEGTKIAIVDEYKFFGVILGAFKTSPVESSNSEVKNLLYDSM